MTDDKVPKLATADLELIKAASGDESGAGFVTLTPQLLDGVERSLDARKREIDETYPKPVAECPYRTRLAIATWVIEHIVKHAQEGGSFRYPIYERLRFEPDAYVPIYMAGGMEISNHFSLPPKE